MTGKAKVAVGCGIGCLVGLLGLVAGLFVLDRMTEAPKDIEVLVTVPSRVARDQEFTIEVQVRNTGSAARELNSLDVADEYLAGVAIRGSEPPYRDTLHVPIDNSYSYEFRKPIPPGGALVVRFRAVGLKAGDHSGDVDVCVDSGGTCTSHLLRTMVE
jgi:hypothetical protein